MQDGPLFRAVDRHGKVSEERLSDQTVARVVKRALRAAGRDAEKFAGHSLRAGLATAGRDGTVRPNAASRSRRATRACSSSATIFVMGTCSVKTRPPRQDCKAFCPVILCNLELILSEPLTHCGRLRYIQNERSELVAEVLHKAKCTYSMLADATIEKKHIRETQRYNGNSWRFTYVKLGRSLCCDGSNRRPDFSEECRAVNVRVWTSPVAGTARNLFAVETPNGFVVVDGPLRKSDGAAAARWLAELGDRSLLLSLRTRTPITTSA